MTYTATFSYLDKNNVIKYKKNYPVEAKNEIEAAIIIRKTFLVIRIREIKNIDHTIGNNTLIKSLNEPYKSHKEPSPAVKISGKLIS